MAAAPPEPTEPTMALGPLDHAVSAVLAGDVEGALCWAGARLAAVPDDPIAPLVVGRCFARLEQRALSASAFEVALENAFDAGLLPAAVAACRELRDLGEDAAPSYDRTATRFARGSHVSIPRPPEPPALTPPDLQPFAPEQARSRSALAVEAAVAARAARRAGGGPPAEARGYAGMARCRRRGAGRRAAPVAAGRWWPRRGGRAAGRRPAAPGRARVSKE